MLKSEVGTSRWISLTERDTAVGLRVIRLAINVSEFGLIESLITLVTSIDCLSILVRSRI